MLEQTDANRKIEIDTDKSDNEKGTKNNNNHINDNNNTNNSKNMSYSGKKMVIINFKNKKDINRYLRHTHSPIETQ